MPNFPFPRPILKGADVFGALDRFVGGKMKPSRKIYPTSLVARGSLRSKLVLSLAAMFLAVMLVNEIIGRSVIAPQFAALEQSAAAKDGMRVAIAIDGEVAHLGDLAKHWAMTIADGNQGFSFQSNVRWACLVSKDRPTHWLLGNQTPFDSTIDHLINHVHQYNTDMGLGKFVRNEPEFLPSGVVQLADQSFAMFATAPLPSLVETGIPGYLLVGREIDEALLHQIQSETQVDFQIQSKRIETNPSSIVIGEVDDRLVVEVPLPSADGEAVASAFVEAPRPILDRVEQTFSVARSLFILGSIAALLSLLLLLQRIVIGPLDSVRDHLDRVGTEGLRTEPLSLCSDDEIGELSHAFDAMVARLAETQRQLSVASQASGRSEVAATVIHNVGNVLTNVNSLLDTASERVERLHVEPLQQLAQRLKDSGGSSDLLEATPEYLRSLAMKWKSDQDALSEMLTTLDDNVRHIHDVIRDQQRYAEHSIELKPIVIGDVLDDAIGCCRARLTDDAVQVTTRGDVNVTAMSDRSLLLQTVINIIGNARHAMRITDQARRILAITVIEDTERLLIRFEDNGCGMTQETLDHAFDAHFTMREGGTGLGLHFCATTIKRFGGSIRAESEGLGLGSTVIIELPNKQRRQPKNNENCERIVHQRTGRNS